ncbi:hypothetical protein [Streptomyces sp. bgisy034]
MLIDQVRGLAQVGGVQSGGVEVGGDVGEGRGQRLAPDGIAGTGDGKRF